MPDAPASTEGNEGDGSKPDAAERPAEPPVDVSQPETEPPFPTQTQPAPAPTPASNPAQCLPDAEVAAAAADEDPSKRKTPEGVCEEKPPRAKAAKPARAKAASEEPKAVSA